LIKNPFNFEGKKNQYIDSLYKETLEAIVAQNMKKVAFNKEAIEALDPLSPYLSKIEQALASAK
jgi:outer membrane protein assembly factor BamD (BamD/ComL family)